MKKSNELLNGFMAFVVIASSLAVALFLNVPGQIEKYYKENFKPIQNGEQAKEETANWLVYENKEYGYRIKYPKIYLVKDKTSEITGGDSSQLPWYFRNDFILNYIEFRDSNLKEKVAFTLETLNTTERSAVMNIGNESIEGSGIKKLGSLDVYLYSINYDDINNMQVIFYNNKAYRFTHYLSEEDFDKIIATFELNSNY